MIERYSDDNVELARKHASYTHAHFQAYGTLANAKAAGDLTNNGKDLLWRERGSLLKRSHHLPALISGFFCGKQK
jgi:hypothetical protein